MMINKKYLLNYNFKNGRYDPKMDKKSEIEKSFKDLN